VVESGIEGGMTDKRQERLNWVDFTTYQLRWVRGGRSERVNALDLRTVVPDRHPDGYRLFDDGSFVVYGFDTMVMVPASGDTRVVEGRFVKAVDGTSLDDFWYLHDKPLDTPGLCHHLAAISDDACTDLITRGAASPDFALAADGTLFVSPRDNKVYRWVDGDLQPVSGLNPAPSTSFHGFRRAGGTLWALLQDAWGSHTYAVYELESAGTATLRQSSRVWDVYGPADSYTYAWLDGEAVDPDWTRCRHGLDTSGCSAMSIWTQVVYYRGGQELGHENCGGGDNSCPGLPFAIGADGDDLFVVGDTLRKLTP
jgi:hypothetical protein